MRAPGDARVGGIVLVPPTRSAILAWAFSVFNTLRVLAYLPTLSSVLASGQSDQHSLLTWVTFAGANATMAMWLHERDGRRWNFAIVVNVVNAAMCVAIGVAVAWMRWV